MEEDIIEKLADNEHNRWSNWQKYVHSKCIKNEDGSLTIPKQYVEHWEHEINTKYKDLPENIKESDRKEVRQVLKILDYENIIARYKEYEKQLDLDYVDNNYIPISKIKEKIEELDKELKKELERENGFYNDISFILEEQIEVLEELLES